MPEPQPQRVADRLAFLLALVPYLLDNPSVPVADVAAHFDVTADQVREAVRLIAVSGVPGEGRDYQHNDLFDIEWDAFEDDDRIEITNYVAIDDTPRLSAREAAALIAGLQYLSALPENADHAALATLTAKLSRGATGDPSPLAVDAGAEEPSLAVLRDAIAASAVLVFAYLNGRGEREERHVEPLRIESVDDTWYLRAWDRARGALRTFRLDRMDHLRLDPDADSERPDDIRLPDRIFSPSRRDLEVVLEAQEAAVPLIADYLGSRPVLIPAARRGWVRFPLRIAHLNGLRRLVTANAGLVRVIEPAEARSAVAEWADAGAARYDTTD